MTGSAAKCFKNTSNDFKSSNDRIEKLKAKTIYESLQRNDVPKKKNGAIYNGPVFVNTGGFLGAVGGYNTNNYDLLLNVAKGRAYSESQCIKTDSSYIIIFNENESCKNSVSTCTKPNFTYDLLEGPFLLKADTSNTDNAECESKILQNYSTYDPSNISAISYSFKKLVNQDKLQNLNLHTKLPITCKSLPS